MTADFELTRTADDRRLYVLDGFGTLRLEGLFSRRATAMAGGKIWRFARGGFFQRRAQALDAAGATEGEFRQHGLRRGGALRWGGRELTLRPASSWRERYALADGDRELLLLDGRGWGRRPVGITVEDSSLDAGLVLFAAFVVNGLASDAASAAGSAAASGPVPPG